METRVAVISIIVENYDTVEELNAVLHEYADHIIGRMGIPYKEKNISVISLIVDGSNDDISALTGKLGRVKGASVKSMVTKQ